MNTVQRNTRPDRVWAAMLRRNPVLALIALKTAREEGCTDPNSDGLRRALQIFNRGERCLKKIARLN